MCVVEKDDGLRGRAEPAVGAANRECPPIRAEGQISERSPDPVEHIEAVSRAEGREVRGPIDHGFIRSIYFRDPNGYVIELTAKVPGREGAMDPAKNGARRILDTWQKEKQAEKV